jgi:hypothetical protein
MRNLIICISPHIVRMIKSRKMNGAENAACMGDKTGAMHTKFW